MSRSTQINIVQGAGTAEVIIRSGERNTQPVTIAVPLGKLPELLGTGIITPEGATRADHGRIAIGVRILQPNQWETNLFPDMPYARFEAVPGGGGNTVCIRGFEPHVRELVWKRDGSEKAAKPFKFHIPRTLWVTSWYNRVLKNAWIYTVAEGLPWPTNVTDENRILQPWAAGNVFEDGHVCWGNAITPAFGSDGVATVAGIFYGSQFNDHIPRIQLKEDFQWKGESVAGNQHRFSLEGLYKQTSAGTIDKTGRILPCPDYTKSLAQVLQSAAH